MLETIYGLVLNNNKNIVFYLISDYYTPKRQGQGGDGKHY